MLPLGRWGSNIMPNVVRGINFRAHRDHTEPISAKTSSTATLAAPRSGGPSVSHRCTVDWLTPKRSPNLAWLSPKRSRTPLNVSADTDMPPSCTLHETSQCPLHDRSRHGGTMQTPADRLRYARELARYKTASDAANAMGVLVSTYGGHENGHRGFTAETAQRYAAFFSVELDWLLTGRGEPRPDNLQARILSLTPDGQRTIRDMLEMLEEREAHRRRSRSA